MRLFRRAALIGVVACLFLLLAAAEDSKSSLRHFTEVLEIAHERYGSEVLYEDLVYASIHGISRLLDPHTTFLTPDAFSNMRSRQEASFFGIGVLVGVSDGLVTVISPLEGGPAARAGMRAGDVISAIDGESAAEMTLDEAVRSIRGPKGTEVRIEIQRPAFDRPLELTIERGEIPQSTVRYAYMITPETGYMAISDFNHGTAEEVEEAIERLRAAGMKRLLLDLRNNGGGILDQAIGVADQFLRPGDLVVETRGRLPDAHQRFPATDRKRPIDLPLVVLINAGTASAAEVFAGAIQDQDVGLIAGTTSWGKASVQTVYTLPYGAAIALTTARYHTPSGRVIQRDYSSWFDYHSRPEPTAGQQTGRAFRTGLGRPVRGGGGINPDVVVEPTDAPPFLQHLWSRNAFFDFAVGWAAGSRVESPDWTPDELLVDEFARWLVDRGVARESELVAPFQDRGIRDSILRHLRGEILNTAFGFEARHKVLVRGDEQILRALELFDEAADLLARRRLLD